MRRSLALRGVPSPKPSLPSLLRRSLSCGASSSSCISIASYGHAVAHSVQPVQASSLMRTSLRCDVERDRVEVAGVDAALIGAGVAGVDEVEVAEDAPVDGEALDAVALLARLLARLALDAGVDLAHAQGHRHRQAVADEEVGDRGLGAVGGFDLGARRRRGAAEAVGHERIDALPQVDAAALDGDDHRRRRRVAGDAWRGWPRSTAVSTTSPSSKVARFCSATRMSGPTSLRRLRSFLSSSRALAAACTTACAALRSAASASSENLAMATCPERTSAIEPSIGTSESRTRRSTCASPDMSASRSASFGQAVEDRRRAHLAPGARVDARRLRPLLRRRRR